MLDYTKEEPIHRKWHHNKITFSMMYAYSERFVLPFSHDEVVHGKKSMLDKMPGDVWQKHAGLRALYGYMYAHPGKKLMFMGGEIGQWREWNHDWQLDWEVLGDPRHAGLQRWVRDLNRIYKQEPALWEADNEPGRLHVDRCRRCRAAASLRSCGQASPKPPPRVTPRPHRLAGSPSGLDRDRQLHSRAAPRLPRRRARRRRLHASCSTATPRSTAAATWATRAASRPRPCPRTGIRNPFASPSHLWDSCF